MDSQGRRRRGSSAATKPPPQSTLPSLPIDISSPLSSPIPILKSEATTPTSRSVLPSPSTTRGRSTSSSEMGAALASSLSSTTTRNSGGNGAGGGLGTMDGGGSGGRRHGHSMSGSSSSTVAAAPALHLHSANTVVGSVPNSPATNAPLPPLPTPTNSSSTTASRRRPSRPTLSRTSSTVDQKLVPGPASAPASTTNIPQIKRPSIPKRYGVHESYTHPPQYYRRMPHHHAYTTEQAPPSLMHWSKAPVFGSLPTHPMRSHTSVLVDNVVWTVGGRSNAKGTKEGTGMDEPLPEPGTNFKNVWCFDTESLHWFHPSMQGDCPPSLRAHSASLYAKHKILVFGGGVGIGPRSSYSNEIWSLDTKMRRWTNITSFLLPGPQPPQRRSHTSIVYNEVLYIFGGGTGKGALNDTWALNLADLQNLRWRQLDFRDKDCKLPPARGYHSATLVKNLMVIYGGVDMTVTKSDMWILDLDKEVWCEVNTPHSFKRCFHSAVLIGPFLFVFGGYDDVEYNNKLLVFSFLDMSWDSRQPIGKPPSPRGYHTAVLADLRMFIFGGWDGAMSYDDTFLLDLASQSYLVQVTAFTIDPSMFMDDPEEGEEEQGGRIQMLENGDS